MKKFQSLLLASAALLPIAAHAQTDSDQTPTDNEIVVVASGVAQPIDQVGQAVTVLDRATIDQRQTVSISDLLATTPGVSVTRNGGVGALSSVRIRGAEAEQTLVLIDGVRVNDPSSAGGAFDFGSLLSGSIDRVEVLRGPNAVAWGSQAIGGVVNVVTEQPTDGISARANAEYGYANEVNTNAAIAAGNEHVQGAITAGYLRSDGISQYANGSEKDGFDQYGGSAKLKVEFVPGFGLDFRAYYAHSKLNIDGYSNPTFSFGDDPEYGTTQEVYGYAGAHADFGALKNRVSFTIADINRDNYDPTYDSSVPSYLYRGRSERYAYQGEAAPIEQVRLVYGAERENSRMYDGYSKNRTGITSVYGQAIVTPVDQVTITAGVRNDDHDTFGSHTTWGANAAVRPLPGTVLRASYGEGFKAPTLYQLYSDYGTTTLRPETAKSWEVGADQSFLDGKARVSATWFHRDTRNQIDFRSCETTAECAVYPYGLYDNVDRARAQGLEFELALQPVSTLTFTANYTYTDAENRSAGYMGKQLARRPQDTANVSIDWRTPIGLSVGGTISIVGDSFNDAANKTRIDGYAIGGLRAEMPINDRFSVYGRIDNVTDEKYQTITNYGTYGRSAYGGVRFRFH